MDFDSKVNCESCGYDLMGLTGEGTCPECGSHFDMVLGRGITRQSSAMLAHQRGDRIVYLLKFWGMLGVAVVCVGLGAWRMTVVDKPGPMVIGLLFGAVFAFGAVVTWFTEGKQDGG